MHRALPARPPALALLPAAAVALVAAAATSGCDFGRNPTAYVHAAYAPAGDTLADVYFDRQRILEAAAPGEVSDDRRVDVNAMRVEVLARSVVPRVLRTGYFDLARDRRFMVVVTGRPDSLVLVAYEVARQVQVSAIPDSFRVVNGTPDTLVVTVGGVASGMGAWGGVSDRFYAAAGAVVSAARPGGGPVGTLTLRGDERGVVVTERGVLFPLVLPNGGD